MGELLVERRPVVGEGVTDHLFRPFPRGSVQHPIGTVPGEIFNRVDVLVS